MRKIADAAELTKDSVVLEVGPGTGNLTEELITRAGRVVAVEIDKDLFACLQEKFAQTQNFTLIKDDILSVDVSSFKLQASRYSIVANLPYNITSRFFRKFLESDQGPDRMVVMVQKEVADRIRATPPGMNLLALSVQLVAEVNVLFPVSRTCFSPKPRVDSAVMALSLSKGKVAQARAVMCLARAGFSAKRKFCASNINRELGIPLATIHGAFEKLGLSQKVRSQEISLEQWRDLAAMLSPSLEA